MIYELQKIFRYNLLNYRNRVIIDFSDNTKVPLKALSHVSLGALDKSCTELSEFNKENRLGYYMGMEYSKTRYPHLLKGLYKYYDKKFYQVIHICEDGSMLYAQSDPTFISNISLTICPKIL